MGQSGEWWVLDEDGMLRMVMWAGELWGGKEVDDGKDGEARSK